MRLRMAGVAAVVSMTLSAFTQAQQGGPVDMRDNDGRLIVAPRVLTPETFLRPAPYTESP